MDEHKRLHAQVHCGNAPEQVVWLLLQNRTNATQAADSLDSLNLSPKPSTPEYTLNPQSKTLDP